MTAFQIVRHEQYFYGTPHNHCIKYLGLGSLQFCPRWFRRQKRGETFIPALEELWVEGERLSPWTMKKKNVHESRISFVALGWEGIQCGSVENPERPAQQNNLRGLVQVPPHSSFCRWARWWTAPKGGGGCPLHIGKIFFFHLLKSTTKPIMAANICTALILCRLRFKNFHLRTHLISECRSFQRS